MDRPTKRRDAARVLVVSGEYVLLQEDSDPGVPGSHWWVTPGGGLDAGETFEQAAVRELFEEVGVEIRAEQLEGPVAVRTVRHGYSDRILIQNEQFFRVEVHERFEPKPQGLTQTEIERLGSARWFPIDALPEVVWPAPLRTLLKWGDGKPIDLGEMDESTVT